MVKEFLEQQVKAIEAEKERQVSALRERIVREKIIPYNTDKDQKRALALAEVDNELNAKIDELKQAYEAKKQQLIVLGEEDKKRYADTVLAADLAVATVELDKAIASLNAQIAEIKE